MAQLSFVIIIVETMSSYCIIPMTCGKEVLVMFVKTLEDWVYWYHEKTQNAQSAVYVPHKYIHPPLMLNKGYQCHCYLPKNATKVLVIGFTNFLSQTNKQSILWFLQTSWNYCLLRYSTFTKTDTKIAVWKKMYRIFCVSFQYSLHTWTIQSPYTLITCHTPTLIYNTVNKEKHILPLLFS